MSQVEATVIYNMTTDGWRLIHLRDNEQRTYVFNDDTPGVKLDDITEGQRFLMDVQFGKASSRVLSAQRVMPDESNWWKRKHKLRFYWNLTWMKFWSAIWWPFRKLMN